MFLRFCDRPSERRECASAHGADAFRVALGLVADKFDVPWMVMSQNATARPTHFVAGGERHLDHPEPVIGF